MGFWGTKMNEMDESTFSDGVGSWTPRRLLATIVGVFFLLMIVLGIGKFALGWFNAGVAVVSPENVTQQFHDAYTRFESLKASACNVKQAQALVAAETNPSVKVQRQDQEIAYEQNYRRIAAEYDAAYDNAFEAKHVGPGDLPRPAPQLTQAIRDYCK